jgi:hypothetical protein
MWYVPVFQATFVIVSMAVIAGLIAEPILRSRALGRRLEVARSSGRLALPHRCVVCGREAETIIPFKPHRRTAIRTGTEPGAPPAEKGTATVTETVEVDLPYCLNHAEAARHNSKVLLGSFATVGLLAFLGGLVVAALGVLGVIPNFPARGDGPIVGYVGGVFAGIVIFAGLVGLLVEATVRAIAGLFDRTMRLMPLMLSDTEGLGVEVSLTETTVVLRAASPQFRAEFASLNELAVAAC